MREGIHLCLPETWPFTAIAMMDRESVRPKGFPTGLSTLRSRTETLATTFFECLRTIAPKDRTTWSASPSNHSIIGGDSLRTDGLTLLFLYFLFGYLHMHPRGGPTRLIRRHIFRASDHPRI